MGAETGIAVGAGVLGGGGIVLWFAKMMFERLIKQLDAVVHVVGDLEKQSAVTTEHVKSSDIRVDRISGEVTRNSEKLEAVSARVEGLSSSYGPRLSALEAEVNVRRGIRGHE